jgi:hypothetical protein
LCRPCLLVGLPASASALQASRLRRALGNDGPDSSPGNPLGAQHLVHEDRLAREPTSGQVLGNRAQHRRALDGLPLHLGDFDPKTGRKLCGNRASPSVGKGTAVEVSDRKQRRRAGNEPADPPRTGGPLTRERRATGGYMRGIRLWILDHLQTSWPSPFSAVFVTLQRYPFAHVRLFALFLKDFLDADT